MHPLLLTLALSLSTSGDDARPALRYVDLDGDGLLDRLRTGADGALAVELNLGGRRFHVLAQELPRVVVTSVLATDLDDDGDVDLYLVSPRADVALAGDGTGRFTDATAALGLVEDGAASSAERVDVDGDGRLDLLLRGEGGDTVFWGRIGGGYERDGASVDAPAPASGPATEIASPELPRAAAATHSADAEVAPGSSSPGRAPLAPVGPTPSAGGVTPIATACVQSLRDVLLGGCLSASAIPVLGQLYPLSIDLNVDSAGNVGVGTTMPTSKLHVVGDVRTTGRLVSTRTSGAPLAVSSTTLVPQLNADLLDGLHASAFTQLGSSIEGAEVTDGTLTGADIADGSITNADISAAAAIAGTKIVPNFGAQDVVSNGEAVFGDGATSPIYKVKGAGGFSPTNGYLGVQGTSDFDGTASADWSGFEIGVAGVSAGGSQTDNYGVMGHSNHVGVRGEYSLDPVDNHGELGTDGVGVVGRGDTQGVYGDWAASPANWGALGQSFFGVRGEGTNAGGLFGSETATLDGVRGHSGGSSGYGVWGRNYATSGNARGVHGTTASSSGYGVYSSGNLAATGTKSFVNPHPVDPTKEIRFVCLEGNESGTYFRGATRLVAGVAVIEVPEEFRHVTSAERDLTVQVTAVGAPATLWVEARDLERIVVRGTPDVELHYFVNGVRRGFEDVRIVAENSGFLPEDLDRPFGTQYPDALRAILVENGLLNPDFTPNAATLARLERELPEYRERIRRLREADAARPAGERERAPAADLETDP